MTEGSGSPNIGEMMKNIQKLIDLAKTMGLADLIKQPEFGGASGNWGTTTDKIEVPPAPVNPDDPSAGIIRTAEVCIVCFGHVSPEYKERHLAWHRRNGHGL
jgi:hypothetical protein